MIRANKYISFFKKTDLLPLKHKKVWSITIVSICLAQTIRIKRVNLCFVFVCVLMSLPIGTIE